MFWLNFAGKVSLIVGEFGAGATPDLDSVGAGSGCRGISRPNVGSGHCFRPPSGNRLSAGKSARQARGFGGGPLSHDGRINPRALMAGPN